MGKKNKKLKKKKQHTVLQSETAYVPVINDQVVSTVGSTAPLNKIKEISRIETAENDQEEYKYINKDIKKILLIMLIIVVLVIVLYFLNTQIEWIPKVGDWLFKILNIQTM